MSRISSKTYLLLLTLSIIAYSSARYVGRHGMSGSQYQSEFQRYVDREGMRLVDVSGYNRNGRATYAALWNSDTSGPAWIARHGLTEAQYQAVVTEFLDQGYRPHRISAFEINGSPLFACIFFKTSEAWEARHDLTPQQYQTEFDTWTREGYRLIEVCGYTKNGATRYAAVWEKSSGPQWIARHGMTSSGYQTEFDTQLRNGYKPIRVSGFEVNGADIYAAIWIRTSEGVYARHGMTDQNYQAEFDNGIYQAMTPKHVCGYTRGGQVRFAALWTPGVLSDADASFIHDRVRTYMNNFNVPGLTIGIMKDERLVWAKGYGVSDKSNGNLVSPFTIFRIASVSKPLTSAAIMRLIETTNLRLTDLVFGPNSLLGDICNTADACIDKANLEQITVQHCLEHTTGWTQDAVWEQYQLNNDEIIKWAAKNYAHTNTPGSVYQYINFNYFLLGRIIEKKSGQTYENYVKSEILSKCGISDMHTGADTQSGKDANEAVYYPDNNNGNPYDLRLRRMDASGGWVGTPISLLKFAACIDKLSSRRDVLTASSIDEMRRRSTASGAASAQVARGLFVDGNWWMHNGCMSGTLATLVHFKNGISIAMAINTRPQNDFCHWNGMYPLADQIQSSSISWPSHNLF